MTNENAQDMLIEALIEIRDELKEANRLRRLELLLTARDQVVRAEQAGVHQGRAADCLPDLASLILDAQHNATAWAPVTEGGER